MIQVEFPLSFFLEKRSEKEEDSSRTPNFFLKKMDAALERGQNSNLANAGRLATTHGSIWQTQIKLEIAQSGQVLLICKKDTDGRSWCTPSNYATFAFWIGSVLSGVQKTISWASKQRGPSPLRYDGPLLLHNRTPGEIIRQTQGTFGAIHK